MKVMLFLLNLILLLLNLIGCCGLRMFLSFVWNFFLYSLSSFFFENYFVINPKVSFVYILVILKSCGLFVVNSKHGLYVETFISRALVWCK
jgi:hypothetical protein